jgi:menaquinone-dependent protoporphyrinogen IX oxidase
LEHYSEDKNDLSNMSEVDFDAKMQRIITKSVTTLKNNRFACFVVSEVRRKEDKIGGYRNFISKIIRRN